MRQKDNIYQFFKTRLLDNNPKAEEWNTPSDDLWNNAKVHFPKKKKKKRRIFWLLFGTTIALATVFIILQKTTFKTETKKENLDSNLSQNVESLPVDLEQELTDTDDVKISERTQSKTNLISDTESIAIPVNLEKHQETNVDLITAVNPVNRMRNSERTHNEKKLNINQNNSNTINTPRPSFESNENIVRHEKINTDKKVYTKSSQESVDSVHINQIKRRSLVPIEFEKSKAFLQIVQSIKPRNDFFKYEIGLSHSPFISSPLKALEAELLDAENYSAETKYFNINLPVMFRLSERFSIGTGLSGSLLNTDLKFIELEIYDNDSPNENLNRLIEQTAGLGSLTLNDNETSFIEVEFLPGVNLQNGDTILIEGFIPLRLKLLQVPIILNAHWRLGKFDFMTHSGLSIDFFDTRISDLNLDIYNQTGLISRQINFNSLSDQFMGISLYLGAGVRYQLYNHWHLGFSIKLDLLSPEYSRYEIGTYYQFN